MPQTSDTGWGAQTTLVTTGTCSIDQTDAGSGAVAGKVKTAAAFSP